MFAPHIGRKSLCGQFSGLIGHRLRVSVAQIVSRTVVGKRYIRAPVQRQTHKSHRNGADGLHFLLAAHQLDIQHIVLRRCQFFVLQRLVPQRVGIFVLYLRGGQRQLLHRAGEGRRLTEYGHDDTAFRCGCRQCKSFFLCRQINMQRRQPIRIELGLLLVGQGLIGRAGPLRLPGQLTLQRLGGPHQYVGNANHHQTPQYARQSLPLLSATLIFQNTVCV